MTYPYALLADIHAHAWSTFATVNADGVNARLQIILDELLRANTELKAAGGNLMVIDGDVFHTRGSISPEVFNPVYETIEKIANSGTQINIIPGNHDLSSKDTRKLTNATQAMELISGVTVFHQPGERLMGGKVVMRMIPWHNTVEKLKQAIEYNAKTLNQPETDLFIHFGIDGVLKHTPSHGLTADYLAKLGVKRVFAGHYHNHKVMEDGKVISIGATTHQTFGDIGTRAGFLLVYEDKIEYRASNAPHFVQIDGDTEESDIALLAQGNYVRVRDLKLTDQQIKDLRAELMSLGARGVLIEVPREVAAARLATGAASKPLTIQESVTRFIDEKAYAEIDEVKRACAKYLSDAATVTS